MKIYALFNKDGAMQKCSNQYETVTNHFPNNTYSTDVWNAMFSASASERESILNSIGWVVKEGKFVETKHEPINHDLVPVCEECNVNMHQFSHDGISGYSCDGCGWSIDT